jgi:hypothetical protein
MVRTIFCVRNVITMWAGRDTVEEEPLVHKYVGRIYFFLKWAKKPGAQS